MRFALVSHTRHVSQVLNTRTSAWADTTYLHKNFFSPKTYDNRNQETESPLGVSVFRSFLAKFPSNAGGKPGFRGVVRDDVWQMSWTCTALGGNVWTRQDVSQGVLLSSLSFVNLVWFTCCYFSGWGKLIQLIYIFIWGCWFHDLQPKTKEVQVLFSMLNPSNAWQDTDVEEGVAQRRGESKQTVFFHLDCHFSLAVNNA